MIYQREAATRRTPTTAVRQFQPGRIRRAARAAGRGCLYCLVLMPVAIAAVIAALSGRARAAGPWWRWLRTRLLAVPSRPATRRLGFFAVVGHAMLSLLLGAAALVPLGLEVVFVLRGVLYGLVDRGPYTQSWGGPTEAGAWLVHFVIGVPLAALGLVALTGITAIHQRLTLVLDGGRRALWVIPVSVVISVAGAVFFVAWLQQLPS